MNQVNRLPHGGRIDRSKPLRFIFDGKPYVGLIETLPHEHDHDHDHGHEH